MPKTSRLVSELVNSLENDIIRPGVWAGAAGHLPALKRFVYVKLYLQKTFLYVLPHTVHLAFYLIFKILSGCIAFVSVLVSCWNVGAGRIWANCCVLCIKRKRQPGCGRDVGCFATKGTVSSNANNVGFERFRI